MKITIGDHRVSLNEKAMQTMTRDKWIKEVIHLFPEEDKEKVSEKLTEVYESFKKPKKTKN